jgi:hypothetical protein
VGGGLNLWIWYDYDRIYVLRSYMRRILRWIYGPHWQSIASGAMGPTNLLLAIYLLTNVCLLAIEKLVMFKGPSCEPIYRFWNSK